MNVVVQKIWTAPKHPAWSSKAIMHVMGAPYSHSAIIREKDGALWVAHADDNGVEEVLLADFLISRRIVRTMPLELEISHRELDMYIEGERGKEYSDMQLLGIAIAERTRLVKQIPWVMKRFQNGDAKRICSEFTGKIVNNYSVRFKGRLEGVQDFWTPLYLETVMQPEVV